MSKKGNLFSRVTWVAYVIYLFSIVVFGDREEYFMISNLVFVVLILLMGIDIILSRRFKIPLAFFSFLPFTLFCYISSSWSYDVSGTLIRSETVLRLIIMMVIMCIYLYKTGRTLNYIYGFAVAGVLVLFYVLSFYGLTGLRIALSEKVRIGTEIVNANTLAIFFAVSDIIFLQQYISTKNRITIIPIIAFTTIIALTGSKKGFIDIVVGALLTLILADLGKTLTQRVRKWIVRVVLVVIIFTIVWRLPVFDLVRERINSMFMVLGGASFKYDYSTWERQMMITAGLKQFLMTPILGIGIGASGYITNQIVMYSTYLHNNYVELLATSGIVGTLLYYLPVLRIAIKNWNFRKDSSASTLSFILIVIVLINDFGSVQYFSKITYVLFSLAISSICIGSETQETA